MNAFSLVSFISYNLETTNFTLCFPFLAFRCIIDARIDYMVVLYFDANNLWRGFVDSLLLPMLSLFIYDILLYIHIYIQ